METMPKDMRAQYFDMYKGIARKCFYPIMDAMLGSAQMFDDMPLGRSNDLLEDAYKRQATNIRNASFALPKIAKILDEIQEESNAQDFGFSSMIASHYSALLERIDAMFNQETPYSAERAVFDNWNGDKTPQYLNIDNQDALKQYLTAQFERIRFLAKDLASPIVDLLTMPHLAEKVKNRNLLAKWKEIIASVDDYENKKPGNSISALESFISDTLSKVSINAFDDQGEIKTVSETGGDYFLSKRSSVAKSLLSRADAVQYEKAATAYGRISKFFDDNLAGKFPFGKSDQDASLKDIESFINLWETQNVKNIIDTLTRAKEKRKVSDKALEFLHSINDKLLPFLKVWIAHSKTSDANSALITFNVQVRPSPDIEALTSSVMDRELLIDNVKVEDNANGTFFNDNKVDLVFNWVDSADEKPNEKGASGNLLIEGEKATFSYAGKWAMFRLIEENKVNKEAAAPSGVLLQFSVPIVDSSKQDATLTSKLVLKITPTAKDGDKTAPMEWPIFPASCPNLHDHEENAASIVSESKNLGVNVSFDEPNGAP
jgi:type VI secretion system protein ImpL